ncbi:MAG: heme-binding protein [Pseudomonadota bacterium]
MTDLTLATAMTILEAALATRQERGIKPLAVAVLDAGGHLKALQAEDGASFLRPKVAHGKAYGALAIGMGSRALMARAEQQAHFINSVNHLCDGALVAVPGGVLMRDGAGKLIGAVGISGDTSDNDEACAIAGIEAAGLVAETG